MRQLSVKMAAPCTVVSEVLSEDKLVDAWSDYPCLYVVSSAEFKDRYKREQAHQELAVTVEQPVEWVKSKLRLLRSSYTRAKQLQPSGSARKTTSKRNKWLLEKLQFLSPHIGNRNSISNLSTPSPSPGSENEDEGDISIGQDSQDDSLFDDGDEDNGARSSSPPSSTNTVRSTKQPLRPRASKRKQAEEEFQLIKGLAASMEQRAKKKAKNNEKTESSMDTFGRLVAQTLSQLDATSQAIAKHKINSILLDAELGKYKQAQNPTQQTDPVLNTAPVHSSPPQRQYYQPHHNYNWQTYSDQLDTSNDHTRLFQL